MNKNNPYGYKVGYRENGNRLFIRHFMTYTYKQARFSLRFYRKYPQRNRETNRPIVDPFWEIKPITKKEYLAGIWDELPFKRLRLNFRCKLNHPSLFEHAMADGIISLNPMAKVKLARYEQEHGTPLTKEEEYNLLHKIKHNPSIYNQAYAFIMYTGLRRSELASVVIEGEWIILTTAKQRKGVKEKSRSIPISPMLKRVLPFIDVEKIKKASVGVLTNRFKDICPNHHLHDLRHTFITRAQECGIRREIVSLWAGHKADSSITTTVYTHFQERSELQIVEMQKYDYKYN